MRFTKMQGAGNDYIYLNGFEKLPADLGSLARQMSDRHFGIGSDGLVIIMPSDSCDFRMRMFNSDGSEAEMCGNASRCVGKYVYDKGLTTKKELTLETLAGVKHLTLHTQNGTVEQVTVDMGEPILSAPDIPVNLSESPVIAHPLEVEGQTFAITCVSMGNPHAVIFLDEMEHRGIPVVVISGGVRQFVEQTLAPFRHRLLGLHAVDLDVSRPQMQLISAYDNGDELLKKTDVMALYDYHRSVGIGDSFTDRNMSQAVDTIFARDILAQYLQKCGLPYLPYENFYDVIRQFPV